MIFQHTHELVLNGTKTQTRRIQKPGDDTTIADIPDLPHTFGRDGVHVHIPQERLGDVRILTVERAGRPQWAVGKTYAVQPGRGKSAIGRIRITGIREQDVREISDADVRAEGFVFKADFLKTWTQMHDMTAFGYLMVDLMVGEYQRLGITVPPHVWAEWENYLQNRPAERYQAWVLEFQLVRP